jgi:protein-S-isoprenylcysteine O-methyltransferase Ste14
MNYDEGSIQRGGSTPHVLLEIGIDIVVLVQDHFQHGEKGSIHGVSDMKRAKAIFSATILTIVAAGQIILSFVLYNKDGNPVIRNIGWIILWISAIFGWLPIYTLKKWGKPIGRGYIRTTVLVNRGIYAVVRHPQYLAGMLMGLALPLIAQHWFVAVLGATAIVMYYVDTFDEEKSAIEKFGGEYERYKEMVPRVNFIRGLIRLIRHRRE